jgi:competence protein ComEC
MEVQSGQGGSQKLTGDREEDEVSAATSGPNAAIPKPKGKLLNWRGDRAWGRPLMPVTLSLMAGIAGPAWGLHLPERVLLGGLAAVGLALGLLWLRGRPVRFLPLMFFWLLGVAFYQQAWQPVFPPHHLAHLPQGTDLTLLGSLNRPARMAPERVQLFMRVEAVKGPNGWRPATGNLLVLASPLEPPPVGTRLALTGRLREPRTLNNPGVFNRGRYLAAEGIFRELRVRDPGKLLFLASDVPPLRERLRGGIREVLKTMAPELRAVYLAMLLGDQGEITPEMRQEFARTGTSHLLVINGLHLSMVAAVTYFLSFWALRRVPWLLLRMNAVKAATLLAAGPVVAYAWVAGGSPSTQRAEVMVLAYLLLLFLGRPREMWSALALAALVILSLAPLRLFAISFQLSFVAVAAIIYLAPTWARAFPAPTGRDWHPKIGLRIWFRAREALAVSAAATLATAPLVAAYFQIVSLLGIVVNLAAIPLVLGLALPLGEAAVFAQAFSLTPVAQALLFLGQWPLGLGLAAIQGAARLPGSAIIMPIPTWLQIGAYYLILVLVFARGRRPLAWAGAALAGVVLLGSVLGPAVRQPQALEITCLDSYGALAGVAVTPASQRLVFSAPARSWAGRSGGSLPVLPGYCHWRQFRTIDHVAALSLGQDNAPELLNLSRQFTVGAFWYGSRGPDGPAAWELWNQLGDRGRAPRSLERGRPPTALGGVALSFPALGAGRGCGLHFTYAGRQALVLPPLRRLEEAQAGTLPQNPDLLVLPGEFLSGAEGERLLARLQPQRLVIYGAAGRGAAAPAAVGDLPCYWVRDGAVSVYISGQETSVRQWGR